jgi:hypothetical protein
MLNFRHEIVEKLRRVDSILDSAVRFVASRKYDFGPGHVRQQLSAIDASFRANRNDWYGGLAASHEFSTHSGSSETEASCHSNWSVTNGNSNKKIKRCGAWSAMAGPMLIETLPNTA